MRSTPVLSLKIDDELELRLRELCYAQEFFELTERNREHLSVWQSWAREETSLEATRSYMKFTLLNFAEGKSFETGIWYQGKLVGAIGLHSIDAIDLKGEIGYWIDAAMQGKGIITRACRTMVSYAFEHYGLNKVEIHCATGNRRSRAVPERLGFTLEGTIRHAQWLYDHFVDMAIYGMLAKDWQRFQDKA